MTVINTPVAKMFCIDHAPFWTKCWVWIKKLGVKRQTHPSTLAFYYEKFQTYGKIIHTHQVCSEIGHILLHLPKKNLATHPFLRGFSSPAFQSELQMSGHVSMCR